MAPRQAGSGRTEAMLELFDSALLFSTLIYSSFLFYSYLRLFTILYTYLLLFSASFSSNKKHPPSSPIPAPATQNDSDDGSLSHMKRPLQSQSNKRLPPASPNTPPGSRMTLISNDTSSTMRGATGLIRQVHPILRLPQKMNLVIDQRHM